MKSISTVSKMLLLAACLVFATPDAQAQRKKKKKKGQTEAAAAPKKSKEKKIEDLVKASEKIEGLFTIYRDTTNGSIQLLVKEDQLDKEFIYFNQIENGVLDAFSFRGAYGGSRIFKVKKFYDKIEFEYQNYGYHFDENSALSKAKKANISEAPLASFKIEAHDKEKGLYLIKAGDLFVKETLSQVKPPRFPGSRPTDFTLGNLDKGKTKIKTIRNYPENTDVAVSYVYSKSSVLNGGSNAVTDGRNVRVDVYHSFIAVPENDYEPRYDDPRVGYFMTQTNDMTSVSATNYRDMIHRWNLVKKDPSAAVSEPVEPITWWIENTTPVEFRETIKEGVLRWNIAFEKAGFKNAMVVKVQPDDADWDAGDIRYNVLRWTSSPQPPFGGYGPSFVNPKTGQIMGADIMLEFVYHTNRVRVEKLFDDVTAQGKDMHLDWRNKKNHTYCSYGQMMQYNTQFGRAALALNNADALAMEGLKKEAMLELIMHEVGHTLGLNHNMKASQLFSPAQLSDPDFIKGKALVGSVMDYTAINVTNDPAKQGHYYSTTVGPYDVWAIQYGYQPFKNESEMNALLEQSTKPELIFGNDADDMRAPGKAIDPRVNTGDLSNDQITYSIDRIKLVNRMFGKLKDRYTQKGKTYNDLRIAHAILMGQYAQAGNVMSRFIGGVYVDRAMAGQAGETQPYTPVSYEDQKRAMKAINTHIFGKNAFKTPNELYNYLARQRRGYNFFGGPEDPKIHATVLRFQRNVLRHIMHPNTLQRISDSELYGNKYDLAEYMTELNNGIFAADIYGSVNSFRQNLQLEYTNMLIEVLTGKSSSRYTNATKSMALYNLKKIGQMASNNSGNVSTKAHKSHLKTLVNNTLKEIK
ncbi:zinc-dependent metalloprotease [Spongiivirga sp. MCCC 1A20706]|uniref:zinc-dependent metalloprotease n=1 Tax=Spongiivirga sp. MCCC 1A20706 TaxID=3160963 RepID=UPI00397728A2